MLGSKGKQLFFWVHGWIWLFDHPKHLTLVIAPLLLGALIVGLSVYFFGPFVPALSQSLVAFLPEFMSSLSAGLFWFFVLILVILFFGLGLILLYVIYMILSAPFNSLLVESVLKKTGGAEVGPLSFSGWLWLTIKMLRTSLIKSFLFVFISVVAFLMSFLPGLQWLSFVVTAAILAFDCMDYSFEAQGFGLRKRLGYFWKKKERFLLLSGGMALTLLVPGLTFLALPGAVVGAALLVNQN
ncbi:hypothetical protein GW916_11395 [bacterium]|nr:hypothetical protein [bacterium]